MLKVYVKQGKQWILGVDEAAICLPQTICAELRKVSTLWSLFEVHKRATVVLQESKLDLVDSFARCNPNLKLYYPGYLVISFVDVRLHNNQDSPSSVLK